MSSPRADRLVWKAAGDYAPSTFMKCGYIASALLAVLVIACSYSADQSGEVGTGGQGGGEATGAASVSGAGGGDGGSGGTPTGPPTPCDEDQTASCGDFGSGCTGCASATTCAEQYKACATNATCQEYNACTGGCEEGDDRCLIACAERWPDGERLFGALIACAVCQECRAPCAPFAAMCPP
jgi:hypothetical protein